MATPTIGEISKGGEFVIEWSIKDFSSILIKKNVGYKSPYFSFANASWYLRICPNGQRWFETEGYISVYLHRKSKGPAVIMDFTLGMKTAGGEIYPQWHATNIFEAKLINFCGTRLLRRHKLLAKKSELLPSDTLTLVCRRKKEKLVEFQSACKASTSSVDKRKKNRRIESLPKNKILQDFKELYLSKEHCDVVFRVKDQEIPAHKAILSARSPVLASMFRHDMKEKTTGIVDIEDFDSCIFSDFLCFLYCEDLENLSEKNVFGLFTAADMYDVTDLREKCMEFIKANLSVETFCETITLALRHNETELIGLTTHFFIKNADKIVETVKWQKFLVENPTHSNELFIKFLAHNKKS